MTLEKQHREEVKPADRGLSSVKKQNAPAAENPAACSDSGFRTGLAITFQFLKIHKQKQTNSLFVWERHTGNTAARVEMLFSR